MTGIQIPVDKAVKAVPRSHMQLLSNFAATWGRWDGPGWGIHCGKCKQDVIASNGMNDAVLSAKCGCQEYASDPFRLA